MSTDFIKRDAWARDRNEAERIGWTVQKQLDGYRLHSPNGSFWPCRLTEVLAWDDLPQDFNRRLRRDDQ